MSAFLDYFLVPSLYRAFSDAYGPAVEYLHFNVHRFFDIFLEVKGGIAVQLTPDPAYGIDRVRKLVLIIHDLHALAAPAGAELYHKGKADRFCLFKGPVPLVFPQQFRAHEKRDPRFPCQVARVDFITNHPHGAVMGAHEYYFLVKMLCNKIEGFDKFGAFRQKPVARIERVCLGKIQCRNDHPFVGIIVPVADENDFISEFIPGLAPVNLGHHRH